MKNNNKSKIFANNIRANALRMVSAANSSHIGSCLSVADVLAVLFSGKDGASIGSMYQTSYIRLISYKSNGSIATVILLL